MSPIRSAYLDAAASAAALLADPATAGSWSAPSALPEFGVSGLAGHLARQLFQVRQALSEAVPDQPPITLRDHYARARWIDAGLDDEVNVRVRRSGEESASGGAADLANRAEVAVAELRHALPAEPADRIVHLPRLRWSLRLDDFLITRMMEIAVHSDDLAVSVGLPTPGLPPGVLDPVLDLLTQLAVRRHGATAVLRAFSRAERAPARITAF